MHTPQHRRRDLHRKRGLTENRSRTATHGHEDRGRAKTIDNDLCTTEQTFGFDTAVHTATEAVDKIHTTAQSHHRIMVVEVMGRDEGRIALHAGIARGGRTLSCCRKFLSRGGSVGNLIGDAIALTAHKELRVSVLGHIHRGGTPSPFDRVLATRFGVAAVDLIA